MQFKKQYKQNENNKKTLDGLFEIFPKAHLDYRGFLVRIDDKEIFHNAEWVQESNSHNKKNIL